MRRFAILLALMPCAGITGAGAVAAERIPNAVDRPVEVAWHYAKCIVDETAGNARRVFAYTPFSDMGGERLRKAQRPGCLTEIAGSTALKMPGMLIRGGIAEHLLAHDFEGINGAARGKFAEIFDPVPAERLAELTENDRDALSLLGFAQCVVSGNQQDVAALFSTVPTSAEEKVAFDALDEEMSACLEESRTLRFSREGLRAFLGEAAYRMSIDAARKRGQEAA